MALLSATLGGSRNKTLRAFLCWPDGANMVGKVETTAVNPLSGKSFHHKVPVSVALLQSSTSPVVTCINNVKISAVAIWMLSSTFPDSVSFCITIVVSDASLCHVRFLCAANEDRLLEWVSFQYLPT
jgi:hypothetical protein